MGVQPTKVELAFAYWQSFMSGDMQMVVGLRRLNHAFNLLTPREQRRLEQSIRNEEQLKLELEDMENG